MKNNQLREELNLYEKDKDEILKIINKISGGKDEQYRKMSILFFVLISVILGAGILLKRISPLTSLLIVLFMTVVKIIWLLYEAQKSMHFQFWILNSIETRINEIDAKQRKILKLIDNDKNNE